MNNKQWHPPHRGHPGHFQQPGANQPVQFCRDCGQYHPIPLQNLAQQQDEQPNFSGSRPQPVPRPQTGSQSQEQPVNFQQPRPEWSHAQDHFNNQKMAEEQDLSTWGRRISMVEAINIALDQVPGEPVEAERKRKHGTLIYEVEIINEQGVKYEVDIDANSGNVISVELD